MGKVVIQHWSGVVTATLLCAAVDCACAQDTSARSVRGPADRRDRRAFVRADGGGVSQGAGARQGRRRDSPDDEPSESSGGSCCCARATRATSCGAPSRSVFCARSRSSPTRSVRVVADSGGGVSLDVRTTDEIALVVGIAGGKGHPIVRLAPPWRREPRRRGDLSGRRLARRRRVSRRLRRTLRRQSVPRSTVHADRGGPSESARRRLAGRCAPPVLHRHSAHCVARALRRDRRLRAVRQRHQLEPRAACGAQLFRRRRHRPHRAAGSTEPVRRVDLGRRRAAGARARSRHERRLRARHELGAARSLRRSIASRE